MRLADDIKLKIGHRTVNLRPSLRAATCLERTYGGFDKLLSAIGEGNLGVMAEVIALSSDGTDVLKAIYDFPLFEIMPALLDKLPAHVIALSGADQKSAGQDDGGQRSTFAEYHAKLYRIATGWLGLSPDQAWRATPSEILEAYNGHLEMLRAIHGGAESEQSGKPDNSELDREGLHSLSQAHGQV
jgi:hypothetical protein